VDQSQLGETSSSVNNRAFIIDDKAGGITRMDAIERVISERNSHWHRGHVKLQTTYLSRWSSSACAVLVCALLCAGCGGSDHPVPATPGLPTPPAASATNTYIGTQSPGLWSVTIDDTHDQFSYQPQTYPQAPNVPISGTFVNAGGFLKLSQSSSQSAGLALEMPSSAVLLRPGDSSTPLVIGVQQNTCFAINDKVRFQFLPVTDGINEGGAPSYGLYGSVVAATDSSGADWEFTDATGGNQGPSSFDGTCKEASGNAQISATQTAAYTVPSVLVVSVSGFFIEDFGVAGKALNSLPASFAGMIQPTSAISASSVSAGTYLGFVSSSQNQPVAFVPTTPSGSSLAGGTFPNDDPTQTNSSNYALALGSPDPSNYGSFPKANLTFPDPAQICQTTPSIGIPGIDQNGNPNCTSTAIAVVGNASGKYQIYLYSSGPGIELYLLGQ
jgi:hypothetical protein